MSRNEMITIYAQELSDAQFGKLHKALLGVIPMDTLAPALRAAYRAINALQESPQVVEDIKEVEEVNEAIKDKVDTVVTSYDKKEATPSTAPTSGNVSDLVNKFIKKESEPVKEPDALPTHDGTMINLKAKLNPFATMWDDD